MVKLLYKAVFLFLILTPAGVKSQVLINQMPINPVQFTSQSFWDISIVNNGTPLTIYLKGELNDENGKRIADAISSDVVLGSGVTNIRNNNVTTIALNFNQGHPNVAAIEQFKNLPYGDYTLCIYAYDKETGEMVAESCLEHTSQPVSSPILMTPDYCSEVYTKYPYFSWLAPMPEIKGQQVYYSFKLTEVFAGQSNEDAIQRNLAIVFEDNLTSTSFQYPSTALPLDSNKTYAWQVQAKVKKYKDNETQPNNNSFRHVGISEAWCLNYKTPELAPIIVNKNTITYAVPKLYEDAEITVTNILYLSFIENYTAGLMNYVIYDSEGQVVELNMPLKIEKGDNRYDINLKQTELFKHNSMYKMEIKGNDKEVYFLKFRYIEQ